jgi:hypothetical protein
MPETDAPNNGTPWTVDVQRGLAWTVLLLFVAVVLAFAIRTAINAVIGDVVDLLKSALAVLFNIVMLILGYFFGSSKTSEKKDDAMIEAALMPEPPPRTTVTASSGDATVSAKTGEPDPASAADR